MRRLSRVNTLATPYSLNRHEELMYRVGKAMTEKVMRIRHMLHARSRGHNVGSMICPCTTW